MRKRKPAPIEPDDDLPDIRLIGYGRVSTNDQNPALQREALLRAGVFEDNLHIDEGWSGASTKRPKLSLAFKDLRPGDTLVVWKLDRLGRDLSQLIAHAKQIKECGAHFRSLTENIDTTTPSGMFFFHMIAAMAEWERAMIAERTKAGMAEAKRRGVKMGRAVVMTKDLKSKVREDIKAGDGVDSIAKRYKISVSLIRKHFKKADLKRLRAAGLRGAVGLLVMFASGLAVLVEHGIS